MTDEELIEDLLVEWEEASEAGNPVSATELCWERPELASTLQRRIDALENVVWMTHSGKPVGLVAGAEPVKGFRLVSLLGRGGMGQVWKSVGPGGFEVALKFLPKAGRAARDELRALQSLRRIKHPNLLSLLGAWETDEWLVLGSEVADQSLFDRWQASPDGLPREETLNHFYAAAAALDYLHELDIRHRDVKPQNMLLQGGVLKVADFGLVRASSHTETGHTGAMTFAYAAPEYFDGRTHRHSDQYALAISYCQIRGGRVPFEGSLAQVMRGHLDMTPDLSMLPMGERSAVKRALAKKPSGRWPTCCEFVEALFASVKRRPPRLQEKVASDRSLTVEAVMERGIHLAYDGKLHDALETFELAVRLDPDDGVVSLAQSITRLRVGDLIGARKACEEATGFHILRALIRFYIGQRTAVAGIGDRGILDFQASKAMLTEKVSQGTGEIEIDWLADNRAGVALLDEVGDEEEEFADAALCAVRGRSRFADDDEDEDEVDEDEGSIPEEYVGSNEPQEFGEFQKLLLLADKYIEDGAARLLED